MSTSNGMKVLCVLYPDPVAGFPPHYAREGIPTLSHYPDGQTLPTPSAIDFTPGHLLGSVSGGLGLERFVTGRGHRFVVTSDKDGPDSVFERELPDADVVISQPFWPGYLTAERIRKAPNLKLAITAGIGSDHVDLQSAIAREHHRLRGHLVQQRQRGGARGHADAGAGQGLHPPVRLGHEGRLEHRRRHFPLL